MPQSEWRWQVKQIKENKLYSLPVIAVRQLKSCIFMLILSDFLQNFATSLFSKAVSKIFCFFDNSPTVSISAGLPTIWVFLVFISIPLSLFSYHFPSFLSVETSKYKENEYRKTTISRWYFDSLVKDRCWNNGWYRGKI